MRINENNIHQKQYYTPLTSLPLGQTLHLKNNIIPHQMNMTPDGRQQNQIANTCKYRP